MVLTREECQAFYSAFVKITKLRHKQLSKWHQLITIENSTLGKARVLFGPELKEVLDDLADQNPSLASSLRLHQAKQLVRVMYQGLQLDSTRPASKVQALYRERCYPRVGSSSGILFPLSACSPATLLPKMSADEFSARVLQLLEEQGSLAPPGDQVWGRDQQMALEAALECEPGDGSQADAPEAAPQPEQPKPQGILTDCTVEAKQTLRLPPGCSLLGKDDTCQAGRPKRGFKFECEVHGVKYAARNKEVAVIFGDCGRCRPEWRHFVQQPEETMERYLHRLSHTFFKPRQPDCSSRNPAVKAKELSQPLQAAKCSRESAGPVPPADTSAPVSACGSKKRKTDTSGSTPAKLGEGKKIRPMAPHAAKPGAICASTRKGVSPVPQRAAAPPTSQPGEVLAHATQSAPAPGRRGGDIAAAEVPVPASESGKDAPRRRGGWVHKANGAHGHVSPGPASISEAAKATSGRLTSNSNFHQTGSSSPATDVTDDSFVATNHSTGTEEASQKAELQRRVAGHYADLAVVVSDTKRRAEALRAHKAETDRKEREVLEARRWEVQEMQACHELYKAQEVLQLEISRMLDEEKLHHHISHLMRHPA